MSNVSYNANTMTITVDGLETVERALGDLKRKTPAAAKVAINATAREARKLAIAKAKARYAVNAAGQQHLKKLKQEKRATNNSLSANIYIETLRNDLGYFRTNPAYPTHFTGGLWRQGPSVWTGKVLRNEGMKQLKGGIHPTYGPVGKGFLAKFKSGHVGMVQRDLGSESKDHTMTEKGHPRWKPKGAKYPEKLVTMGSPSATAMHNTIWMDVEPDVETFLLQRLDAQVQKVLARAGRA